MPNSRPRLCLVGCLCVPFQRLFCLIPEHPIRSYPMPLLCHLIFQGSSFLDHFQFVPRALEWSLPELFQMWRSVFRVLSFQRPWLSCLVPTLMSFWAWIGLSSTKPRSIVRPRPCC